MKAAYIYIHTHTNLSQFNERSHSFYDGNHIKLYIIGFEKEFNRIKLGQKIYLSI